MSNSDAAFFGEPFIPDSEIVYYHDFRDAAKKIEYYLSHERERASIQHAGHQRALQDHTFEHRIQQLFAVLRGTKKNSRQSHIIS